MKLQHIVATSDLSAASRLNLLHAARLANRCGGRVTVLHVDELGPPGFRRGEEVNRYLAQAWGKRVTLLHEARQLMRRFKVPAKTELASGEPAAEILNYVRREEPDLLIMGQRGLRGIKRLLKRGTLKRVVRRTPIPTLVLPPGLRSLKQSSRSNDYDSIVCTTDFSTSSRRGLFAALDLAELLGAHVEQVHVLELPVALPDLTGDLPIVVQRTSHQQIQRDLLGHLKHALGSELHARCTPSVVLGNNVARSIKETAETMKAELICVPSRGRGRFSTALLGSTAERIIKIASVPVLFLPASYLAAHYETGPQPTVAAAREQQAAATLAPGVTGREARQHVVRWRSEDGLERSVAERRREPRTPVDIPASLILGGVPHRCRVTNASRHGVRVERRGGLKVARAPVVLALQLPGQSEVTHLSGRVTRRSHKICGIRLEQTADPYRQRFVRYIDHSIDAMPLT